MFNKESAVLENDTCKYNERRIYCIKTYVCMYMFLYFLCF